MRTPYLLTAIIVLAPATGAAQSPPKPAAPTISIPHSAFPIPHSNTPDQNYTVALREFQSVEPQYPDPDLIESFEVRNVPPFLAPLAPTDPNRAPYTRAAQCAEAFLKWSSALPDPDPRAAAMLYIAANSEFSLTQWKPALANVQALLQRYPDYTLPRLSGHPELNRPARIGLQHLELFLQAQAIGPKTSSPLAALQTIVALANATFDSDSQWRAQIESSGHHETVQLKEELEHRNLVPDQLRANGLPTVTTTVLQLHEALLPAVIKTSGPKATRDYLRTLATSGGRFSGYASAKLVSIDRDILAAYRAQAQSEWNARHWAGARAALQTIISEYPDTTAAEQAKLDLRKVIVAQYSDEAAIYLAAHDYDNAKASYRKIIAEFPDGDEAAWADGELRKIVPTAVVYYKMEGDLNFHPEKQLGKPQARAREYFEKMFKADPTGTQADYAFYYWNRTLATEGQLKLAVTQLLTFATQFPNIQLRAKEIYLTGFIYAGYRMEDFDSAIKWMKKDEEEFPESPEAPEAMWSIAFYYGWTNRFQEGLPYLEKLVEKYPNSKRSKWAPHWINEFKRKIASGEKW